MLMFQIHQPVNRRWIDYLELHITILKNSMSVPKKALGEIEIVTF